MTATDTTEDLKRIADDGAERLGWESSAEDIIAWVASTFDTRDVSVACSMADAVLPSLVADQMPGVDVLFLDTGYHFAETMGTRDMVAETMDVNVVDLKAELSVPEQDEKYGKDLFARDPAACCRMRKVEPLAKALSGYKLWFTGVRREEAPTRTNTPLVSWDETHGLIKVNPVAPWTFDELVDYANDHRVPVNMLLMNGYPSIGCQPCTQPVAEGEDPRAGRWAGQSKTECGIHL